MTSRPHDALFKTAFADPAHIPGLYCRSYPPEICAHIDWSSLQPAPASFVDAQLDDDHGDLLYAARLRSSGGTAPSQIYLLLEHQSTNDSDMPLRMHTYLDRIYTRQRSEKHLEPLAHVLPLIVSHAPGGWTVPCAFSELFAPPVEHIEGLSRLTPQFEVVVLDVSLMSNVAIDALDLADFAKLVLWLLRDGRYGTPLRDNLEHYWAPAMTRALQSPGGDAAVSRLLRYVYEVTEGLIYEQFCAIIRERIPGAERLNMTMAEELKQRGRLEGRLEGSVSLLEKQLTLKFGPLGAEHRERLSNATVPQLELYAQRVLTADTLEAIFGPDEPAD